MGSSRASEDGDKGENADINLLKLLHDLDCLNEVNRDLRHTLNNFHAAKLILAGWNCNDITVQ